MTPWLAKQPHNAIRGMLHNNRIALINDVRIGPALEPATVRGQGDVPQAHGVSITCGRAGAISLLRYDGREARDHARTEQPGEVGAEQNAEYEIFRTRHNEIAPAKPVENDVRREVRGRNGNDESE